MFDDYRSKKVIILSHCLLNQNSALDGTTDLPSQFNEIIEFIMESRIGIIQLPCPELLCLGLDRGDKRSVTRPVLDENTRVRKLLSEEANIKILNNKAEEVVMQIKEYLKYDFKVLGLIGADRSPSCGIETTTKNGVEVPGKGVFMEILSEASAQQGIKLRMIGSKTSEKDTSMEKIKQFVHE